MLNHPEGTHDQSELGATTSELGATTAATVEDSEHFRYSTALYSSYTTAE